MHIFGVVAFLQATGQTGSYSLQADYETNEITIGLLKSSRNERAFFLLLFFLSLPPPPFSPVATASSYFYVCTFWVCCRE